MPEDRKKVLEALVAKRKAEAEADARGKNKRQKSPLKVSKPVSKPLEKIGSKGKSIPSVTKNKQKEVLKPKRGHKLDRYETDDDEEEEEEEGEEEDSTSESESESEEEVSDGDSEDQRKSKSVKKPTFDSKGKAPVKSINSLNGKAKDDKGKGIMKDKGKGMAKVRAGSSSSEDEGSDDDDDGDLSDDPLNEVDPSNILPSRTRRVASQPGSYQFTNLSGDDDDDDDSD